MPRAALARGENAAGEAPEPALADGEAGGAALYSVQPEETELLLTALPEGAAELLTALDQWELDGQGRSFCAVSAQTLEALSRVRSELGLKTVLGVSNISFGLPARPLVNQNFLAMAMAAGLDLPILNPNVDAMMAAVRCYHLLMNIDTDAREFIAAYGNATVSTSITSAAGMTAAPAAGEKRGLEEIVEAGLKGEA